MMLQDEFGSPGSPLHRQCRADFTEEDLLNVTLSATKYPATALLVVPDQPARVLDVLRVDINAESSSSVVFHVSFHVFAFALSS